MWKRWCLKSNSDTEPPLETCSNNKKRANGVDPDNLPPKVFREWDYHIFLFLINVFEKYEMSSFAL